MIGVFANQCFETHLVGEPGFIGLEVVKRQKEAGPPCKRLVQLRLNDSSALCYHEEPIIIDGRIVGTVTSGMYGFREEASLAMGYILMPEPVTAAMLAASKVQVEVADRRIDATAQLGPWYDPKMARVKS